jgi:hypothetical protein
LISGAFQWLSLVDPDHCLEENFFNVFIVENLGFEGPVSRDVDGLKERSA